MRLKWGETEYKGRLVSVDLYMNIQLNNTEEFIDGKSSGQLGQVLIRYDAVSDWNPRRLLTVVSRCNNVLWIGAADTVEPKTARDTSMSG